MYLKDLTLRGFKSFASATRLRFEPGITCIVGPNGSGKSNVVDALSWVMGEQGAKSLRGAAMADVIFAGSTGRPALGRAQVELTIDNGDGRLPISYSEVTISRTMFRSGGSEYAINGQPVRLLDVQELLSDTGMGRQMHAIVGQGQLDRVLTATPQERRAFIDEAAGVAKHRRRKERALRKLETMDANLVRVLDLTEEIRKQLRPLARQAKAAREAAGVRSRLDYARARLLAVDTLDAHERLEKEHSSLERLRTSGATAEQEIAEIRARIGDLQQENEQVTRSLEQLQERYRDFREVGQRLQSIVELARERAANADRIPVAVSGEAVELSARKAAEAADEAEQLVVAAAEAQKEANQADQERSEKQALVDQARGVLAQKQKEHEASQRRFVQYEQEMQRLQSAYSSAQEQQGREQALLEEAQSRLDSLPTPSPAIKDQSSGGAVTEGVAHQNYESAVARETDARKALDLAEKDERAAVEEHSRQSARRDTLRRSLGASSPQNPAHKTTTEQTPSMRSAVESAPLMASLLKVERGWEDAIGALLGPMVNAPLLAPQTTLTEAQTFLNDAQQNVHGLVIGAQGSITTDFVPPENAAGLSALSVATTTAEAHQSLSELLEGCWVVESAEEAARLFADTSLHVRAAATRDGNVFTRHTAQTPGVEGTTTLKLRADLEEAEKQAAVAEKKLEVAAQQVQEARALFSEAAASRVEALDALRKDDAQRAAEAQEQARITALHHAAHQDVERAEEQLARAQSKVAETKAEVEKWGAGPIPPRPEEIQVFLHPFQEALALVESDVEKARDGAAQARMASHIAQERAQAGERQARAFRTQAEQLRADRERQMQRQTRAEQAAQEATEVAKQATEGLRAAEAQAQAALSARETLSAVKRELDGRRANTQNELDRLEQNRSGTREQLLQAEVAFAQFQGTYRHHLDEVRALLQTSAFADLSHHDEASADPEASVEDSQVEDDEVALPSDVELFCSKFGPHTPWQVGDSEEVPFSREIAVDALRKSERELTRLGVVNPLAVEEHAALKARYDFLLEQVEDLNRSKADLLSLIKEVDTQVKEAFISAFDDTSEKFGAVFERLFPGGTGRLELTEPDDPLTTGVEIYARPLGKKVTRLSLLSGGERSLAALAYLIAIFLARPSPFYVMDEVEAALDDTNLSRVLSLFQDLRDESQLLIITHQKRTMEIADALYGVSMRDGVTTVVSHRMD